MGMSRESLYDDDDFPVYSTPAGGMVVECSPGEWLFIKATEGFNRRVGEELPAEWGIIPENTAARAPRHPQLTVDQMQDLVDEEFSRGGPYRSA